MVDIELEVCCTLQGEGRADRRGGPAVCLSVCLQGAGQTDDREGGRARGGVGHYSTKEG